LTIEEEMKARCWDVLKERILKTQLDVPFARRVLWEMANVMMLVEASLVNEPRKEQND
jgi:hypothetical protein